jgi:ATP-independent RNA helicase DbpA
LTLCGGQPFGAQRDSLQHAPHIIVATPGRLLDHLQKGTVSLDALQTLVMDEADRMLDMGFSDAIDEVIRFAPADRQTLLFSYLAGAIAAISGRVQKSLTIEIDTSMRCRPSSSSSLKPPARKNPAAAKIAEPASACILRGVL